MVRCNNTAKTFGDLAEQYSVEPGSQKLRGEVPPIKKYGGQPQLEQEAFALRPGELSGIIQIGDKFIILRCEEYTTPEHVEFAAVRGELYQDLLEKKTHLAMRDVYEKLQDAATIDNFLANTSHSPTSAGRGCVLRIRLGSGRVSGEGRGETSPPLTLRRWSA